MKTLSLAITGGAIAIAVSIFWLFARSYDFSTYTMENPLGIHAKVVYGYNHNMTCPFSPCNQSKTFQLNFTSKEGSELIAYNICDEIICTKKEGFENRVINAHAQHGVIAFGTITAYKAGPIILGNLPWKVSDTVDIRIEVIPVTVFDNGSLVRYPEKIMFVDLGESKITEVGNQTK